MRRAVAKVPTAIAGGCRASSARSVGERLGCRRASAAERGGAVGVRCSDLLAGRPRESVRGGDRLFHTSGSGDCDVARGESAEAARGDVGGAVARLRSRGVARLSGRDLLNFLQGLVSNDVSGFARGRVSASSSSSPSSAGPDAASALPSPIPTPNVASSPDPVIYATALTPQGRFLYDLFLYGEPSGHLRLSRSGNGPALGTSPDEPILFADVDRATVDELLSHLKKYRLRAKVGIEDVSDDFAVWASFGGKLKSVGGSGADDDKKIAGSIGWGAEVDAAGVASAKATATGWTWVRDPRLGSLGFRGIFPAKERPPSADADKEVGEERYRLWRYENGVAEGPAEIEKGEAFPLEYNLDQLNAISYEKGCYVGQELTARTHHRGVVRKRLVPLRLEQPSGSGNLQSVSAAIHATGDVGVLDVVTGKQVGRVVALEGKTGIGILRLQAAFREDAQLKLEPSELTQVRVIPSRPSWWPEHWGNEEKETSA
ncbi:hypothetical protein CBR_g46688 [Chara braunii]|uniref:CAF17 C-terminal domain-containing protein n=1 Tax=Chara braunii TaxID=69332 RepID=A0A388M0V1_CHABU|nr:hypothetical protein CBR_g46688 [Chara braunii]|eukprot:GBG88200.1 hypothetical protein CBR_g46688 [Chara braunii]